MNLHPKLETLGAALSDQSRVAMLCELMDARAYTSTELAAHAGITPQTATTHLARLREAGLITSEKSGRSLYHRLAGEQVAQMLEGLSAFTSTDHLYRAGCKRGAGLLVARRCYNHLAGRLGVAVTQALVDLSALQAQGDRFVVAPHAIWAKLGVTSTQKPVKRCLDWTERRAHVSGPPATEMMKTALQQGWLRQGSSRALHVTKAGAQAYAELLKLDPSSWQEASP